MGEKRFSLLLTGKVDGILELLKEEKGMSSVEARIYLYSSELYRALENEDTKMWYFSCHQLHEMLKAEKETGEILW